MLYEDAVGAAIRLKLFELKRLFFITIVFIAFVGSGSVQQERNPLIGKGLLVTGNVINENYVRIWRSQIFSALSRNKVPSAIAIGYKSDFSALVVGPAANLHDNHQNFRPSLLVDRRRSEKLKEKIADKLSVDLLI
jgi:hypothetical protein